jgi:hypothetical protein
MLLSADRLGTHAIMREAGVSKMVVWRCQVRLAHEAVDGLLWDKTRPARNPPLGLEVVTWAAQPAAVPTDYRGRR